MNAPSAEKDAACLDWPSACQHTPAHDNGRFTPEPRTAEKDARCQSDGGISVPGNHRCECLLRPEHEGRHGCHCGGMWTCWDCPDAEPYEGCAACGALPLTRPPSSGVGA